MVGKMDANADSFIDVQELAEWIKQTGKLYPIIISLFMCFGNMQFNFFYLLGPMYGMYVHD